MSVGVGVGVGVDPVEDVQWQRDTVKRKFGC